MPVFEEFSFPSSTGENTIRCLKCLPDGAPRGVVQIEHGIAESVDHGRVETLAAPWLKELADKIENE